MKCSDSDKLSRNISVFLWIVFVLVLSAAFFLVLFLLRGNDLRSEHSEYEQSLEEKVELLCQGGAYSRDIVQFNIHGVQDEAWAQQIRDYFHTDSIIAGAEGTWEKTLALACFVASNIPHANQTIQPEKKNAIALWEYTKQVEPAFNCRLHSIMLFELLNASGISATYITCLPKDFTDPDCHVVNQVWLPELGKWAMIDSDEGYYASDESGTPLSLSEIRERYISKDKIYYHEDFQEGSCQVTEYYAYMAKNTYWFHSWENIRYDQETNQDKPGRIVLLAPEGFQLPSSGYEEVLTHDDKLFWAAPEN